MGAALSRQYAEATSPEVIEGFSTSWLLPPAALFVWRALISLYIFAVQFTIIGYDNGHADAKAAGRSFSYFTVLGYWGLACYFAVAAIHSLSYWIRGRSFLQSWPSALQWAHSCFYSTITTFPFIVTIVFWTILSKGALRSQYSTWSNISEHALNSVFAFSELVLPRTKPHPWINLIVVIVLLAFYLALAELTYAIQGFYVYVFLDPSWLGRGVVAGACVGILVGTAIVFVLIRYLILLRQRITEGKSSSGEVRTRQVSRGEDSINEDIQLQVMADKGSPDEVRRLDGHV